MAIAAFTTACKLAVIVVKGGEVQSTGSGTCIAGTVCIVDVTDPDFSEIFTAIPDDGWHFTMWNSGERFFCGGSTNPRCTLSFEGYEETKAVQEMVDSSETFYLMPVFREVSNTIKANGKEWMQPVLFSGLSWNDIDAVCTSPTGVCAGRLNGFDMTGWTWASVEDANALFNYYIGSSELGPGPSGFLDRPDSKWARKFNIDGWLPTYGGQPEDDGRWTEGWLRDVDYEYPEGPRGQTGAIFDERRKLEGNEFPPPGDGQMADLALTTRGGPVDESATKGGWFHRNL